MAERPDLRIGIDVGGTNTDAVVLDRDDDVRASVKVPTTEDVTGGIVGALSAVLAAGPIDPRQVAHVMLGTTHATNAVLERRHLDRVAVIRIGAPATRSVRPLAGWPEDLRGVVSAGETIVGGGSELDGRELAPFDGAVLRRFLGELGSRPDAVAITSVFAPVSEDHERRAAEVVGDELGGDVPVSLSHEIGSIGLLERENATVLNAALGGVARRVLQALGTAVDAQGIQAVAWLAQNDGTLMGLEHALRFPVLTIGSGPANSLRGAAALTGLADAIVVDVGGTTADVGVLVRGFPRESSRGAAIGGVRTNFRAPDVLSVAIGGGTVVRAGADGVEVGPDSVSFRLTDEALVFGGDVPTLTDAAVAARRMTLGDPGRTRGPSELLRAALAVADARIADAVDRMKTAPDDVPLVVVGGAASLVPDRIPGAVQVHRPALAGCANAIGAAIATASGQVEHVVDLGGDRDAALAAVVEEAVARAVSAGADRDRTEVVEIEEVPLAYLTEPAVRVRVRAAGPLSV